VVQVVERLPRQGEALSSTPSTAKKKKKRLVEKRVKVVKCHPLSTNHWVTTVQLATFQQLLPSSN
jgi:hypothetical protein